MPVAPSFQTYKVIIAEPFIKDGKPYITVEHPRTLHKRDVRWYTDTEFNRAFPAAAREESIRQYGGLKHARGFDNGYILCARGNNEDWLRASSARYAVGIGWYFVSTEPAPANIPDNIRLLFLTWEEAILDENTLKSPGELKEVLDAKARKGEWYIPPKQDQE